MPKNFLFILILSLIASCIEVEISVPGFPEIANYFNVSEGTVQLTIAYNFFGFCISAIFYGPLSECYGRRKMMIVGNALLVLSAIGCSVAPTINWLLASRFIQGLGASTSAVIIFAMIADVYHGEKVTKLIGVINSFLTVLMAIAPIIGGFINKWLGWRGNYGIVAAISLISWILLVFFLPETNKRNHFFDIRRLLKDYKKILSNLNFISSSLAPSLFYSAYMSFVACASFLYIETFGLSIIAYAFHQAVIVATFALVSAFSNEIIKKLGSKRSLRTGILISFFGSASMVIASMLFPYSSYLITFFMSCFCVGFAIFYPIVFSASLEIFPEIKGTTSSAIMSMRACISFGMIALTGYFYDGHSFSISLQIFLTVCVVTIFSVKYFKNK